MLKVLSSSEFDSAIAASPVPVLVDFFGDWCVPCKRFEPILDEVASERANTLQVFKVDAGQSPEIAARFRIKSVPNFILFRRNVAVAQRRGTAPKREFLDWIDFSLRDS